MDSVYIDTNIFLNPILYDIEKNDEAKKCKKLLERVIIKEIEGITSLLTWDEFVWILNSLLGKEISERKGKELVIFPNLSFKKIKLSTINHAQDIYSKYNIRPRDSIHIACALENRVKIIYSLDKDFDVVNEIERKSP